MRTGSRWTTLIQLPVAFWAGIDREGRAGAAGKADHPAVVHDLLAIEVARQHGRLPGVHAGAAELP